MRKIVKAQCSHTLPVFESDDPENNASLMNRSPSSAETQRTESTRGVRFSSCPTGAPMKPTCLSPLFSRCRACTSTSSRPGTSAHRHHRRDRGSARRDAFRDAHRIRCGAQSIPISRLRLLPTLKKNNDISDEVKLETVLTTTLLQSRRTPQNHVEDGYIDYQELQGCTGIRGYWARFEAHCRLFPGTPSRIEGISIETVEQESRIRHNEAYRTAYSRIRISIQAAIFITGAFPKTTLSPLTRSFSFSARHGKETMSSTGNTRR